MKRAKIVKAWAELGDERPRLGDFEDYMNRPMGCGPYGIVRAWDVFERLTRGEYWWMCLDVRRRDCSLRVAKLKAAERRPRYYAAENPREEDAQRLPCARGDTRRMEPPQGLARGGDKAGEPP